MLNEVGLKNFRNYSAVNVNTNSELVLILGPNAAGKTNFLEAVYYLSRLKSFRAPDNLLVRDQEDYFKITGLNQDKKLEAVVQVSPKLARVYKINDQKLRKTAWKTYSTVLFVPQDLNLFDLGPALRRKYLNQILSQASLEYALDLTALDHVLKQRAALFGRILEGQARASELGIWNLELASVSVRISAWRKKLLDYVNLNLQKVYASVSDFPSKLEAVFKGVEEKNEEEFLGKLATYEQAEIRSGQNLYGPQKDDFIILKNGRENIYNSSRGELRSQVLALKLLEADYLDSFKLETIVLLDDVFSELDEIRRNRLIGSLAGHQIFITTTEEHHLPKFEGKIKVLEVGQNSIKQI